MADLVEYEVARDHLGDDYATADNGEVTITATQFRKGDTRTAPSDVVSTIVGTLLVDPNKDKDKAEPGHKTKVEPKPKNKGEAADKAAADKAAADKKEGE